MKKFSFIIFLLILFTGVSYAGVSSDCRYNGIPLYGDVQVVENFPDFKVEVVNNFEDLRVKKVDSFASSCGQWKFVNSFPDFKVKFVNSFGDFSIKYVDNFEGI